MPVNNGNFPKSTQGANKMKTTNKSMAAAIKADKVLDKKLSLSALKKDIAADRKLLAAKLGKKKGK